MCTGAEKDTMVVDTCMSTEIKKTQENRGFTCLVQSDNYILANVIAPDCDSESAGEEGRRQGCDALQ